jgi:hypothetical protein
MMTANKGPFKVSPHPDAWHRVYKSMCRHAEAVNCDPPPKPLILAGAAFTNDIEKATRWDEFVRWANANGCLEMVDLPLSDFYFTDELSDYSIGPMGGPIYLPWSWDAKPCPSREQLQVSLETLLNKWSEICPEIAMFTKPLRFSGEKKRALLVIADQGRTAPWGSWESLSRDESKRATFRQFRASVNKVVAPHMVDHIIFRSHP